MVAATQAFAPPAMTAPRAEAKPPAPRPAAPSSEYVTTPYATYTLIGACVVMFMISGGFDQNIARIYRYGASYGPAVAAGDWWRLLAPMFLHFGLIHIGFNMFALYLYGPGLERLIGPV